jgi:hypothetical protein
MSGGSGGMPAASNKGQQMQNPQMGQQGMMGQMPPQGGMFGGMQPQSTFSDSASGQPYMGQVPMGSPMMQNGMSQPQVQRPLGAPMPMIPQMTAPGGMPQSITQAYQGLFGDMPMQTAQQMPTQMAQQMPPQAFDQFRQEEMMMGRGMEPSMGAGIAALGGQMPMGGPMDYGTPRFPPQGMPQTQPPYQPYMGGPDIKPTNMGKPEGMLPAGGMPPGFRPTSIDGRRLRDMMDITKRRFMGNMGGMRGRDEGDQDRLPGAIGNDLPPALRRPTQGGYKNFK